MSNVLEIIRKNMDDIRRFGVRRIGVFGSHARGDQRDDSDIDVVVEFEEGMATLENFLGLADYLERLLGRKVDLLTREGVRSIRIKHVREEIERTVVYVS